MMGRPRTRTLLEARIRAVWRRTQMLHAVAGLLAFFRWAVPVFLVSIMIDRSVYLPAAARGAMLAGLLGVALYKAWCCGWRRLQGFDATRVALQLERKQGGLESLLVTAVQLCAGRGAVPSGTLLDQITRGAEAYAAPLRPETVVPVHVLHRPGLYALLLAGVMVCIGFLDAPFLMTGVQRIFTPWVTIAYPTNTQLAFADGDLIIKQGEATSIEARVAGVVPERARLLLRTGTGRPLERSLAITNGVCRYTIAAASRDFTYRLYAGDARSDWRQVRVIPPPRITAVHAVLTFPSYLQRAPETLSGLTLTVPEGTQITWTLSMDRPLRAAHLFYDEGEPQALALSTNGLQVTFSEMAMASRGYYFEWTGMAHGFRFGSPRHYLQVEPDQPPRVALTQPAENLHAILGREVAFKVRAHDDHGIADASLSYRVNLRPIQTVSLKTPPASDSGEQPLDWDYRTAIQNLKIGDTVAISVEVRDRYAGPGEAHVARSDTRRITFLSREDYLAEIAKRKDRLLSQVRGLYRQERTAHDLMIKLAPSDDAYAQTVQLESTRQEMLRGELGVAAGIAQDLLDDLAANGVADAPEGAMLDALQTRLKTIAEEQVAHAAQLLRESGEPSRDDASALATQAVRAVDLAARELARLVLLRDIDSALEVFAREVRAIAQNSAGMRRTMVLLDVQPEAGADADKTRTARAELANEQEALAQWTRTLLAAFEAGMHVDKRPLAVLNLTRRIKDLHRKQVAGAMERSAAQWREGRLADAMASQAVPIHALLAAEFSVRYGVEYQTVRTARDQLLGILRGQQEIQDALARGGVSLHELVARQAGLRADLAGLLLPAIPAPQPQLFTRILLEAPDVEALIQKALGTMEMAAEPQDAAAVLGELVDLVSVRTESALVEMVGLGKAAGIVSDWAVRISDVEARQIGLLEDADMAAADEKPCAPLVEAQQAVVQDLTRFQAEMQRENAEARLPERDLAPLLGRLSRAQDAMQAILPSLQANQHDSAIAQQERAADEISAVLLHAQSQGERFAMLESLLALARSVRKASRYVADIGAEQRDILAAIEEATPQEIVKLISAQENLRRCVTDVAPLLDFVAGQLDVGTPLAFSGADMGDAIRALEADDRLEASDALDAASASMEDVTAGMRAISRQVDYVAEIVEALDASLGDSTFAAFGQEQIRNQLSGEKLTPLERVLDTQRSLVPRVEGLDQQIVLLTGGGLTNLVLAAPLVKDVLGRFATDNLADVRGQMTLAAAALDANATGLLSLIRMVNGLPTMNITTTTDDATRRLLAVLAVASEQHALWRDTQAAGKETIASLAQSQQELAARCRQASQGESVPPELVSAEKSLTEAAAWLKTASRDEALAAQEHAGHALRHFILAQALLLKTEVAIVQSMDASDAPPSGDPNTSGSDLAKAMSDLGAFVSGEIPADKQAEWEILQQRSRAALHQNFARELPLEYRGMLKHYFEKVAR